MLRWEQANISSSKQRFKNLIDTIISSKKGLVQESQNIDKSIENMMKVLTPEQTAKFLILMEKFKSKEEFSSVSLWNVQPKEQESEDDNDASSNSASV